MEIYNPWRTYSIFISSTFADMQAERDYLKNTIFPRIEEELRERRIKLDVVDLRWGVDTTSIQQEDERESTVLKVCLDEIEQTKPFFIGLLGDRYGWVPDAGRMKKVIEEHDSKIESKGKSVTALEIEFGVVASKEQLKRSFFYFRKPLDYKKLSEDKKAMFCDEYNPQLTPKEKTERKEALDKLKKDIKKYFDDAGAPDKVKDYALEWDDNKNEYIGLIKWGDLVYKDILKDSERYAEATWDEVPKTWEAREQALLDEFIVDHTHAFCGRTKLLDELKQHLLSGNSNQWGLVLTGESGSGKSSVFAKMYTDLRGHKQNVFILAHSVGISPRSKNVADLLNIWIKQLWEFLEYEGNPLEEFEKKDEPHIDKLAFGEKEKPKLKIEELQEKFSGLLFKAAEKKRVIIFIDALDRFEPTPRAKYISWFPTIVPANMRMLCTAITGTELNAVNYHKGLKVKSIDHFSPEEAKDMLTTLCKLSHKNVPQKVAGAILAKRREDKLLASSSPLWLSLAVNIMMTLDKDDFEKMSKLEGRGDAVIENYMEEMAKLFPALPGELFINLINKACLLFGKEFTNAVFNFIAISRLGLREKDFENLIPKVANIHWDPLQYATLRRWFRAHLIKQGEELQWNLAHSILRNTLQERIENDECKKMNNFIASHLLQQANTDALRISETMHHLMEADNKQVAAEYYGGELGDEEVIGATKVLAEAITINKDKHPNPYLEWTVGIFNEPVLKYTVQRKVGERLQFPLCSALEVEGSIEERLILLQRILPVQKKFYDAEPGSYDKSYDLSISYVKLGDLFQTMGQLDKALDFFEKYNQFKEELYKANPNNEGLKDGIAISYEKLGSLFQTMGQLDKALSFFEKYNQLSEELYKANPNNEGLKDGLAISYEKLGSLFQSMGQFDKALDHFEKDAKLTEELYIANPHNEGLKKGLAISYRKLGSLFQTMGQLDKSLDFFEKYNQINEELYKANPNNEGLKDGLTLSYERLGYLFQTMGQFDKALDFFEKNNQIKEELYKANPDNEGLKIGLAISYGKLGDLFQTMGQLDKALEFFEKYNQFNEELYKANPNNEELKRSLAISYGNLGDLFKTMGQFDKALNFFEKYNQINEELYKANPNNEGLKGGLAISYVNLGDLFKTMGQLGKALDFFEKYNQLSEELYKANPNNEGLKNGLAISYGKLGDLFQTMGQLDKALNFFEKYNQLSEELYKANPNNEGLKNGLAISYGKLGELFKTMGQLDKALNFFEKYNQLSEELYKANPNNEGLKNGLAISYGKLGELFKTMGQLDKALNFFEKYNQINEELYEANPSNMNLIKGLGVSNYKLGILYFATAKTVPGKEYLVKSGNLIKQLFAATKLPKYQEWLDSIKNDYGVE